MKRFIWLVVLATVCSLAATQSASADTIVNIDLEGYRTAGGGIDSNVPPTTYSGVGAAGGGNVFNGISPTALSDNTSSPVTGDNQTLSAAGLLNSTGAATGIGFSIGPVGVDNENGNNGVPTAASALFSDYVFNNSAKNGSNASFTLSGLVPGALYDVYLYHSNDPSLAVTGGTLTSASLSGIYTSGNTLLYVVNADGSGHITGTMGGGTNVFDGLSIFSTVPEPSSFVLCGLGAIGMFIVVRRRRTSLAAGLLPCLLALALGLTSATAEASHYSAAVLADNPVAYWQFGEANGTVGTPIPMGTTSLNSGTLGSSANGTYSNGNSTVGSIIPVSQFYGMAGSPSVSMTGNGQIQGSDAGFPSGNSDRTVVAWVDTTRAAGASWNNLVAYGTAGGGDAIFLAAPAGGAGNAEGASQYFGELLGTDTVNNGSWHMVGLTLTGTDNYSLYVDGKLDVSGTMATNTVLGQFYLGLDNIGNDAFTGQLAQVAIFNSALSGGQMSALYQAALVPEPASILLMVVGLVGPVLIGYRRSKMFAVAPARK